jgi:tRNA A-37 threonylcarbamoyl transferase component Bud32
LISMADHSVTELATILPQEPPTDAPVTHLSSPESGQHPVASPACVPGHELICELGRGGMGVVYKARQTALNRIVAVKVVLSGGHASGDELARFLAEAEAVARMQHPNIVQIFERGQHDGLPYFTLEYVEGGNLASRLSGTPMPPRQAAQLVEMLARGVHYAHSQGVVHRDLKPVNVLLAKDGSPKITDFGLAKRVESASDLTRTGAIMGTPSYMAPEQATGKSKQIGPACDIYALGAILYECLTGRAPFKAATPLDTILQVVNDEPVAPSRLQTHAPRDLETICLKCLQKEPARRYATALALADDLHAFMEGRPISARPVGRMERASKWVRRNRVLTAAIAAVTIALLAGTAVSTYFAIHASREADRARYNEGVAEEHEADAVKARNDLAHANDNLKQTAAELEESRNNLESTLARSWLRPLAPRGADEPMTEGEWLAMWEAASNRSGTVGYRFFEEALHSLTTTRQLRDRAPVVFAAVVGLDSDRRDKVVSLLQAHLKDPDASDAQKAELALAMSAWDGLHSPSAAQAARELICGIDKSRDAAELQSFGLGLAALAARLHGSDATAVAELLLQTMVRTQDPVSLGLLAGGLPPMTLPNRPQIFARASEIIISRMKDAPSPATLPSFGAVAPVLGDAAAPVDASAQAAAILVQAMKDCDDVAMLYALAIALPQLAVRSSPKLDAVIVQAADVIKDRLAKAKDAGTLQTLVQSLSAMVLVMTPSDVATTAAESSAPIFQLLKSKDVNAVSALNVTVTTVADLMDAKQRREFTKEVARLIVEQIKTVDDRSAMPNLMQIMSQLLTRLDPDDVSAVNSEASEVILRAMKETKDIAGLTSLAQSLAIVATTRHASDAIPILVEALKNTTDANAYAIEQPLLLVAAHADEAAAARAVRSVLQQIQSSADPNAAMSLGQYLPDVGSRLAREDAIHTARELVKLIQQSREPAAIQWLAKALGAVVSKLDAADADRECAPASDHIVEALKKSHDGNNVYSLVYGLVDLLPKLDAKRAAPSAADAAAFLVQFQKESREPSAATIAAPALVPIIPFLDKAGATQTARDLVPLLRDSRDIYSVTTLAGALQSLAQHVDTEEGYSLLIRAIIDTQDRNAVLPSLSDGRGPSANVLAELAQGLMSIAGRLDDNQARRATFLILEVMKDNTVTAEDTAQCLSALLTRLDRSQVPDMSTAATSVLIYPAASSQPLAGLALLMPSAKPLDCRLTTRELVELLKMPTCIGPTQTVILQHLGNRYRRPFTDVWQFVDFAREHKIDADWLSPPQRFEAARPAVKSSRAIP